MNAKIGTAMAILIFAYSSACANTVSPDITAVAYANGVITITLASNNKSGKESVANKIKMFQGSLTGSQISFDIKAVGSSSFESAKYQLDTFSPALQSGLTYYLSFQSGAFNNSASLVSDVESNGGGFLLSIP
jgi:hypothetical protein